MKTKEEREKIGRKRGEQQTVEEREAMWTEVVEGIYIVHGTQ